MSIGQNICFFYILVKNYFHFGIIAIVCCIDKQVAQICPLWHIIHLCWRSHHEFIHHRDICQRVGVILSNRVYTAVLYLTLIGISILSSRLSRQQLVTELPGTHRDLVAFLIANFALRGWNINL